jgi:poly(A) polymerase
MITQLIDRLLGRGPRHARPREPKILRGAALGVRKELISPNAIKVCETLQRAGFKAYIVGGAVRDVLLGVTPKDFDVATNATPEDVKAEFRRALIIGRRFRLVHVMFGREVIETSTFRALNPEAKTDAHGRVLTDNLFGNQSEDAARRDFTVNALYYDPQSDEVLDYHGGVADLKKRVLRMIGDPATRYREDPVRMLRSVRFAAKLQFTIEQHTRAPIREMAQLVHNVPAARLFDEMLKLLQSGHAMACLHQLRDAGLHHGLLPLLDVILEQPEGALFVEKALGRTDERVREGKSVSPGFLFATLLWQQVRVRWEAGIARGEFPIPALMAAIDQALDEQSEQLAIQKRFIADMREIWSLQPRFERRTGSQPYRLLEHMRYRAGFDFLMLRADAREIDPELVAWWDAFADASPAERDAMIAERSHRAADRGSVAATSARPRRRRRRSTPRSEAGAGGGSSHETDHEPGSGHSES